MDQQGWLIDRFEENRSRLRGVAYRMLGSLSEAEDAVQEAWLRLNRADIAAVENLGGWLTTVVSRVCLDMVDPGITRRLRAIPGVASVNLKGAIERELVVEIRPRAMQASRVSVGQLVQALQSQNLASPVGRLEGKLDERTIRLKGRLDSPEDFKQLTVSQSQGRIVRLGDVADVRDATEEPRSSALYNDEKAVGIDILKSSGFSTTAVADEIRRRVSEIQATLPAGVTLRVVMDAGVRVANSVRSVEEALLEGAALTVAVVFLFLNSCVR